MDDLLIVGAATETTFDAGERRFRALVENISDAIAFLNRQGKIVYSGPSTTRILGYEIGQNVGRDAFLLVHPDDRPAAQERFAALLRSPGASVPIRDRLLHRDGSWRHVEGIATNLLDESGVRSVVLTYRDVTERIAAEAALRESEGRYRSVIAALDEGIIVQNREGTITAANESACRILGLSHAQLIGRRSLDSPHQTVHADGSPFAPDQHPAMVALATGRPQKRVIMGVERPDGTRAWLSVNAQPLFRDDAPTSYAAVTSFTDITEQTRAEAQLVRAAQYDALTGLPNRRLFMERLTQMFDHAQGDASQKFALLFLDCDHFKAVNDSLGHVVGDDLLAAIADRLAQSVRPAETVARLGGDEFAVLTRATGDLAEARALAARLHQAFAAPFPVRGHALHMTASIGIALSGPHYDGAEEMLRDADAAMYRAKDEGRGQSAVADAAMRARMRETARLADDLRDAIRHEQMQVAFAPVVNLRTGQVAHFEARLRWPHPAFGLLSPELFLPIADEMGLRTSLDRALLRAACRQLRGWREALHGNGALAVSVRLSGSHLINPHFAREFAETVRRAGVPPASLIVQFAEHVLLDHGDAASALFDRLRAIGTRVQLDRFGARNVSLLFLRHFAIDSLKIDRTLLEMLARETDLDIVGAVVMLAHKLGMQVVADGIASVSQWHALRECGCDFGQGTLFADSGDHRTVAPLIME